MTSVAPHVRLAFVGEDLVAFDLAADRYVALPGAVVAASPRHTVGLDLARIEPAATDLLASEGMLILDGESTAIVIRRPTRSLPMPSAGSPAVVDHLYLLAALARTGRLVRGRHCRTFAEPPLPAFTAQEERTCGERLTRLEVMRLLMPTPRRCLPAAMMTAFFLRSMGLETELVFGVRGHPFEAHCWLQRHDTLIDDDLDRVRAYTPIAVGRL